MLIIRYLSAVLMVGFIWSQILLQSYFENDGKNVELVVPKRLSLQQLLCEGPTTVDSDDDCDFEAEDSLGL
jgi:hypothetical protein